MCFGVTEDLLKEGDVPVANLLEREVYSYVWASFEACFPSHLSLCQEDSLNTQLRVQSISMATTSGYSSNSIHVRDLLGRSSLQTITSDLSYLLATSPSRWSPYTHIWQSPSVGGGGQMASIHMTCPTWLYWKEIHETWKLWCRHSQTSDSTSLQLAMKIGLCLWLPFILFIL